MARKRASMREGPLADLFRSTEESVAPDEIRVTATNAGAGRGRGRGARAGDASSPSRSPSRPRSPFPSRPRPGSRARFPGPSRSRSRLRPSRWRTKVDEFESHHEGLERLMGGGPEAAPAFGRDEPDTARYAPARRAPHPPGRAARGRRRRRRCQRGQPDGRGPAPGRRVRRDQHRPSVPAELAADVTLHIGAELTRGLGSGSDPRVGYRAAFDEQDKIKEPAEGLRHGLPRLRRRRRHRHRRRPGGRQARPRHRRAHGRRRHQAVRLRGRPPRRPGRGGDRRARRRGRHDDRRAQRAPAARSSSAAPRSTTPSVSPTTSCARPSRASPTW